MKSIKKCIFLFLEVNCGKIQGQYLKLKLNWCQIWFWEKRYILKIISVLIDLYSIGRASRRQNSKMDSNLWGSDQKSHCGGRIVQGELAAYSPWTTQPLWWNCWSDLHIFESISKFRLRLALTSYDKFFWVYWYLVKHLIR